MKWMKGLLPVCLAVALTACSSNAELLENAGVTEDEDYKKYEQLLKDGLLDNNGFYVDENLKVKELE